MKELENTKILSYNEYRKHHWYNYKLQKTEPNLVPTFKDAWTYYYYCKSHGYDPYTGDAVMSDMERYHAIRQCAVYDIKNDYFELMKKVTFEGLDISPRACYT